MATVLAAALSFAALRSGSEAWTGSFFLATQASLGLALVGGFCRQGEKRASWIGFALFGWIYLGFSFATDDHRPRLPTQLLLDEIFARVRGEPVGFWPDAVASEGVPFQIWHCLWALLSAAFGGFFARTLFGAVAERQNKTPVAHREATTARRNRWTGFPVLSITSLELAVLVAFGGKVLPPGLWAALTFLLAAWLLGLFALWARFGHGMQRKFGLGAAVLGMGFLIAAFGHFEKVQLPVLPTVVLLDEIRPWLPAIMSGYPAGCDSRSAENARVYSALERIVRMHVVDETLLEDVLKHIQMQTAGADGTVFPIELAPPGNPEATRTPALVRSIDLDGVPVRTALRLCLDQFDLTYHIRNGAIVIDWTEADEEAELAAARDAYQIVGHCLLALIAAAIGGGLTALLNQTSLLPHEPVVETAKRT
jgi:hypothetical protein